jgi:hypothetical protein
MPTSLTHPLRKSIKEFHEFVLVEVCAVVVIQAVEQLPELRCIDSFAHFLCKCHDLHRVDLDVEHRQDDISKA